MPPITNLKKIVHLLSRSKVRRLLLLLNLVLWPVAAWAYYDDVVESLVMLAIALLVFSLVITSLVWLGWWVKRKFWAAEPGDSVKPWFFIFSFSAVLISVVLGLVGVFVIPEYGNIYANLGEDLPTSTRVVFGARYFLWLDIVLVAVLWRLLRNNSRRTLYFSIIFVLEEILLFFVLSSMMFVGDGCG